MSNLLPSTPLLGVLQSVTKRAVANAQSASRTLVEQNRDRARLRPGEADGRTRHAGDISLLSREECLRLLKSRHFGRYAYVARMDRPDLVPVNYILDGRGRIVVRSGPGPKLLAAQRHAYVAFEVDEINEASRTGWSVVVTGRAEAVMSHDGDWLVHGPQPWAGGPRRHLIRITPSRVEGRYLS